MLTRLRHWLLLLMLLVLPVNGIAATLSSLACSVHGNERQHADVLAADGHAHAVAHDAVAHGHAEDGETGNGDHAPHLCCHHFSSAAPSGFENPVVMLPPVFLASFSLLTTLFIPEKPQRPPRG